ncbi:MAG: hybrid sensor histidine kinase/response regulator [Lachnospiraceae bacterium]|nr:hybrid sensor histidine kinase/response regulator [Lachnospiraceae bacterium]
MDKSGTQINRRVMETETITEAGSVQFYLEEMQRMNNQLLDTQRELMRALKIAEDAKREKEQFYSAMNHDIRIPLSTISGLTKLALDEIENTDKVKENLENIKKSSEYITSIITDILDIGQMEKNSSPLEETHFCLQEEIEKIRTMMSPLFENKHQILICDMPQTQYYLYGSWKHVRRIITNLLSNASKYTQHEGRIVMSVAVEEDEKNHLWTTISVQDNGMGMTEEQRKNLFTPYFRTDRAEVKMIQGTGLGLAIVKRFTRLCGGSIEVVSQEGCGSTFTVKIPFARGVRQLTDLDFLLKSKLQDRDLCYLLCEDNQINTRMIGKLLEKYGIQMDSAENGKDGIELFQANPHKYAGVFMDMYMPVMGGLEAVRRIRQMDAEIPIVALTGEKDLTAKKKMQGIGVNEILEKPLDVQKFYKTIYHFIK